VADNARITCQPPLGWLSPGCNGQQLPPVFLADSRGLRFPELDLPRRWTCRWTDLERAGFFSPGWSSGLCAETHPGGHRHDRGSGANSTPSLRGTRPARMVSRLREEALWAGPEAVRAGGTGPINQLFPATRNSGRSAPPKAVRTMRTGTRSRIEPALALFGHAAASHRAWPMAEVRDRMRLQHVRAARGRSARSLFRRSHPGRARRWCSHVCLRKSRETSRAPWARSRVDFCKNHSLRFHSGFEWVKGGAPSEACGPGHLASANGQDRDVQHSRGRSALTASKGFRECDRSKGAEMRSAGNASSLPQGAMAIM